MQRDCHIYLLRVTVRIDFLYGMSIVPLSPWLAVAELSTAKFLHDVLSLRTVHEQPTRSWQNRNGKLTLIIRKVSSLPACEDVVSHVRVVGLFGNVSDRSAGNRDIAAHLDDSPSHQNCRVGVIG